MNISARILEWLALAVVFSIAQRGQDNQDAQNAQTGSGYISPLAVGFQPYDQSDIGPADCLSPSGDGSKVTCTDIGSLWIWPINPKTSYPIGAAADVGVKKMAELINREQRLLPGYRLVPTSIDDADSEEIAFHRTMKLFMGNGYQQFVAMGSLTDNAGRAQSKFSNTFQMPLIAGGAGLTMLPDLYENAVLHWWNYQNAFTGIAKMLWDWRVESIFIVSETYIDGTGLLRRQLKTIAEDIGMAVEEAGINTGSYVPGETREDLDYADLGFQLEKSAPKDIKVWFVITEHPEIMQSTICQYVDDKIAGWLYIFTEPFGSDFITIGDKDSSWRSKCGRKRRDEDLEEFANFMTLRPASIFDGVNVSDDTILGCFPQDASLEYARSRNATVRSFLSMMSSVKVNGGVYPFEDTRWPLYSGMVWPGYSASMMCQLALALREQFDKGVTLQEIQQHKESDDILKKMTTSLKNQTFNGAWGRVAFQENSNLRKWRTEYFLEQNREWVKFGEWDPVKDSYTIDSGFIPQWRDGRTGWDNIPTESFKCEIGSRAAMYACEPCPVGTFGAKKKQTTDCKACLSGHYQAGEGMIGAGNCTLADRGYHVAEPGDQIACPPGQYQAFVGQTACNSCEPGSFTNASASTECERCPIGTYADVREARECKSCGFGFATKLIGSYSVLDCGCKTGQYLPCILDPVDNPCRLNRSDYSSCTACPEGFECPGFHEVTYGLHGNASTTHMQPKVLLGNFASVEEPYNAYICLHAEDLCLGGSLRGDAACGGGRVGIQCSECNPGYFSQKGAKCATCTGGGGYLLVPVAAIIVCVILCGVYFINKRGFQLEENQAESSISLFAEDCSALASSLIACLSTCQILALFSSFSLAWPAKADSFFRFFSVLLSDMEVLGAGCFVGYGALVSVYLPNLLGPVAVLVLMCVVVSGSIVLSKITSMVERMDVNIARNSIGSIIQTMAVALGASVLTIFECTENPSADSTLRSFDGFDCFGDEVKQMLPLAILGILLYIVGVVTWFAYIIYAAPSQYHVSVVFRKRNRFLVQRWAPDKYWYGLPLLIRNYLMSMVPTMTIDPLQQLILAFIFMGVLYMVMLRHQPWRQTLVNDADAVLTGSIFLVLFFGMALMPRAEGSDVEAMSYAMILVFCGSIGTAVAILFDSAIKTRYKKHPNQLQPDSRERFFTLALETSKVLVKDRAVAEKNYNSYFNGTGRSKRNQLDQSLNEFLAYIISDEKAQKNLDGIRRPNLRPISPVERQCWQEELVLADSAKSQAFGAQTLVATEPTASSNPTPNLIGAREDAREPHPEPAECGERIGQFQSVRDGNVLMRLYDQKSDETKLMLIL